MFYKASGQYSVHDFSRHVGQSVSSAQVLVVKLLVVKSHEVKNRSMEVIDVHGVFYNIIPKFITLAIDQARLYSTTRHPNCIAPRMMVPAVIVFR